MENVEKCFAIKFKATFNGFHCFRSFHKHVVVNSWYFFPPTNTFVFSFYFIVIIRCHFSLVLTTVWLDDYHLLVHRYSFQYNIESSKFFFTKFWVLRSSATQQVGDSCSGCSTAFSTCRFSSIVSVNSANDIGILLKLSSNWPGVRILLLFVQLSFVIRTEFIIKFQQKLFTVTAVQVRHTAQIYKWKRTRFHFCTRFFHLINQAFIARSGAWVCVCVCVSGKRGSFQFIRTAMAINGNCRDCETDACRQCERSSTEDILF